MRRRAVMSEGATGRMVAWGWGDGAGEGRRTGVADLAAGGASQGGGDACGGGATAEMSVGGDAWGGVAGASAGRGGGAYLGCFCWKKESMDDCVALVVGRDMTS